MTNEEAINKLEELLLCTDLLGKSDHEAMRVAIEALGERPTGEWIPVSEELPDKNGFYLVTVSGYGKHPHMKILGYDAIGKKWGEGGVVAWCNISPYEQEAENE